MAKPPPEVPQKSYAYSISRQESGFFITRSTIVDNKVTATERVSEPDMLILTMKNLEKLVRKELGV